MTSATPGQARMTVDMTADDYAEFAAYVYKRPNCAAAATVPTCASPS